MRIAKAKAASGHYLGLYVKKGASSSPFFVRLIPDFSAAALRQKKHKESALWHRLRTLDLPGKGIMSHEVAIQGLIETFAYSRRTAYRHLDLAEGRRANPISRQSIEGYTGVDKCQQLRLEKKARVRKTNSHGVCQVKDKNGRTRVIPERQLIVTKKKQYETDKRTPNIYHSQAKPSNKGMLKRVGSQLKARSLIPDEAASIGIPTKRYFPGFKSLLRSVREHFRKERYLPFEGYRLLRNDQRLIRGRIEWCKEVICA